MPPAANPVSYDSRLADAIIRRRYDPAISPLSAVMSLQDLIDANFCKNVSQELAKDGRAWEVHRAMPDLWQQLPDSPGLYMFVLVPHLSFKMAHPEKDTTLPRALYVGQAGSVSGSGSLKARYRDEYRKYVYSDPDRLWDTDPSLDRQGVLKKYLNLCPLQYWYLEVAERETIGRLETGLIKLLNPPLNRQRTAKLKPVGAAGPAF